MTEDLEKIIKSLTREIKVLNKKLSRSEANRVRSEKMKDQTDALYQNVLEQLSRLSKTDALTGIANRRYLDEFYKLEWHQAIRSGLPLSVLMIDVDYFKLYNDEYGHTAGDVCLSAVAKAIGSIIVRATDLAARFGGEEFSCVLTDTDAKSAQQVAERIRKAVSDLGIKHSKSSLTEYVTISIGIASHIPVHGDNPTLFFNEADENLYQAKEQGRNRVVCSEISALSPFINTKGSINR